MSNEDLYTEQFPPAEQPEPEKESTPTPAKKQQGKVKVKSFAVIPRRQALLESPDGSVRVYPANQWEGKSVPAEFEVSQSAWDGLMDAGSRRGDLMNTYFKASGADIIQRALWQAGAIEPGAELTPRQIKRAEQAAAKLIREALLGE